MGTSQDSVAAETKSPETTTPALLSRAAAEHRSMAQWQGALGNAAIGRLARSSSGRASLARLATGGRRVLARDAYAIRELGPNSRPQSWLLFKAYSNVSYDIWKRGENPTGVPEDKQQNGPWEFIGGSVGRMFGAKDPSNPQPGEPQHTCAGRLSWALNHSGMIGTRIQQGQFVNDPSVAYAGKPGDGLQYIVSAPAMQKYLTQMWGKPDRVISRSDQWAKDAAGNTVKTSGDASTLRDELGDSRIAVFAGAHHVGLITNKLKTDDYIYYDPEVVPAVAWILPEN